MNTTLFLAPATRRNNAYQYFDRAILEGVEEEFYGRYTDGDYGNPARIWGLTTTQESTWENISSGDWALFYTEQDQYQYAAQVVGKENNPELGDAIRSDLFSVAEAESDRDWNYLVFFDDPVSVDVSGKKVANLLDYSINFPNRFMQVTEDRLELLENEYETVGSFIQTIRTEEE